MGLEKWSPFEIKLMTLNIARVEIAPTFQFQV